MTDSDDVVKLEKRICVAVAVVVVRSDCHVVVLADHRLRTLDDSVVSRGSVSDSTYIYRRIYACAGTEERKTRSWPLRAVRLLNPTVGVSRLLTRAFSPPRDRPSWRQASPSPHLDPSDRVSLSTVGAGSDRERERDL